MARKKGGGGGEGGSWMDTYGDLVTLLLCFFVLLYSMSSLDQSKWEIFVRSIYPGAQDETQESVQIGGEATTMEEGKAFGAPEASENDVSDADVSDLYLQLAKGLDAGGVEGATVSRGKDYTFVVFRDKAFFEGDSTGLTLEGERIMDIFCNVLAPVADQVSQINIMGHTAQGSPDHPNNPRNDRLLSVMRAAEVSIYIQDKNIVDPSEIVDIGYGQYRPIESNDTEEGRSANRRVEILLIDKNGTVQDLDKYYKDMINGTNADTTIVTDGNAETLDTDQVSDAAKEAVKQQAEINAANAALTAGMESGVTDGGNGDAQAAEGDAQSAGKESGG